MYFSLVPNIAYDEKPIKFPFSESDYVIAKNFFRRYKINDDIFSNVVFFTKYAIEDGERPDTVSNKAYGDPFYDWVVLMTNNLVNAQFDWPKTNYQLYKEIEAKFDDPYATVHHYETYEIGQYPAGLVVDEAFYNGQQKLNINGSVQLKNGNEICRPVTIAEWYTNENEKKREIFLLKPQYLESFVDDFKRQNLYKKDANYISQRLKKTG